MHNDSGATDGCHFLGGQSCIHGRPNFASHALPINFAAAPFLGILLGDVAAPARPGLRDGGTLPRRAKQKWWWQYPVLNRVVGCTADIRPLSHLRPVRRLVSCHLPDGLVATYGPGAPPDSPGLPTTVRKANNNTNKSAYVFPGALGPLPITHAILHVARAQELLQ